VGGLEGARSGLVGEIVVAIFLFAAVSHRALTFDPRRAAPTLQDPQVRLMLISVLGVTALLVLRGFVGASDVDRHVDLGAAARAVWGCLFTVLSYLTTTGFESRDWMGMQLWSNLPAPGLILLGVAVMGGGVATTAGGVKLLRLYALYRQGVRELEVLVHPSSVRARGQGDNFVTMRGARVAFVFLMLFLGTIAVLMLALTATGLAFEQALALAVAGLTTTGPAIDAIGEGMTYDALPGAARAILCVAMIVGRIEVLVLVALFNPTYWR
jgi:trk system potassium uptake protein TrkH